MWGITVAPDVAPLVNHPAMARYGMRVALLAFLAKEEVGGSNPLTRSRECGLLAPQPW